MSDRPNHTRALLLALFVTLLWSSSWVLIRWGMDDEALQPLTFASLRYALAAIVLCAWVAASRPLRASVRHFSRRNYVEIAVLGIVFYALTQGAQFVAIDSQPAATTSVFLSWTPLLVALLGARSIAEGSTTRQIFGSIMVGVGAVAYFAGDLGATVIGVVASVVGLGANVVSSLLGRHVNRDAAAPAVVVTTLSMGVGAAILMIAGVAVEGIPTVSARAWLIIAWLAVVNTALAFTLWNLSLQRLTALESAAINNTMLIQIAILAWVFLDEPLGIPEGIGITLVTLGVLMAQAASPRRRRELSASATEAGEP
jgi:drug/metabolite transporter (DMT)-like permease